MPLGFARKAIDERTGDQAAQHRDQNDSQTAQPDGQTTLDKSKEERFELLDQPDEPDGTQTGAQAHQDGCHQHNDRLRGLVTVK
jgi:hypothetical protein